VKLYWKERGGPPVKPPKHKGFGSRLLQNALGGDPPNMDFDPRGLECVLDVVLERM
jgi:two-component system CheB/CheR fusion protein